MKHTLKKLNDRMETLIIKGQTNTAEFKRLMRLHAVIVRSVGLAK